MGMDLIPRNEDTEPLSLNWTSWGQLGDLLQECGEDISELSGSNDGEYVNGETSASWAVALASQLDNLMVLKYPDDLYVGGFRTEIHVIGSDSPVDISSFAIRRGILEAIRSQVLSLEESTESDITISPVPDTIPEVLPLPQEDREWLQEIISFLQTSGGFEQC